MKYQVTVNNEDKCQTNNFNTMDTFIHSIECISRVEIAYIEDDRQLKLAFSGINACGEYSRAKKAYRMGR